MDDFSASQIILDTPPVNSAYAPQALILAAGRGQRLGAKVEEFPKCMLQVGGRSLLDHQLSMLAAEGIYDVCVVAGYQRNAVARACQGRAHVIDNPLWADSNSLYSLWLARNWVNRSLVVMNCDVLSDQRVLSRLLANRSSSFAFDSASGTDDEHMKVELFGHTLKSMSKTLEASQVHGENVGMLHFSADDAQDLFVQAGAILEDGGKNMWMAAAVQELARRNDLTGVDVRDLAWIEIDYQEDLEDARRRIWPSIEPANQPGQARAEPLADTV
ncbi:MAG: phosphocholine cytidylyltransferase family protein [Gammaproteobacteria bacterium]|nr:MAG: phosphocholine cytidylyltransferase family protein [Gammaproteobacteria bacterium]